MTLAYRTVIEKFAQLSDGDRSCVFGMLKLPDTDQMTTKGSAHDQFYLALETLGWAQRAKLDDELDAIGLFAAWTLTPEGRTRFPGLLAGAQINTFNEDYESRLAHNFTVLAVKFAIGYALAHIGARIGCLCPDAHGRDPGSHSGFPLFGSHIRLQRGRRLCGRHALDTAPRFHRTPARDRWITGHGIALSVSQRFVCAIGVHSPRCG